MLGKRHNRGFRVFDVRMATHDQVYENLVIPIHDFLVFLDRAYSDEPEYSMPKCTREWYMN